MKHLSATDLDALALSPAEMRAALAETLAARAAGQVHSAPKSMLHPGDGRLLMSTLAADDAAGLMVLKSLVQNPANAAHGLPAVNGIVTALSAETGLPLATLDGNWITAQRTAALSMLAAQSLARDDAQSVAFLGSGVQAQSHLSHLAALYPLREILIHARSAPARLEAQAAALGLAARRCDTAQEAVSGADIVISCTSRDTPDNGALDASWLAPGAFLSLVDLGHNWARPPLMMLDVLAIDDLSQEAALAPEARLTPLEAVSTDLAGLASGAHPGRTGAAQRTAFLFRGPAFADLSLTALALSRAGLL